MTSHTPCPMAPHMILALSPVLALLVSPGYTQYMGHGGEPTVLYDLTASTEQQCDAACRDNRVCNRYLFEKWNSKCYLFWCPDVATCETNSLEDPFSFHRMEGQSVSGPQRQFGSVSNHAIGWKSSSVNAQNKDPVHAQPRPPVVGIYKAPVLVQNKAPVQVQTWPPVQGEYKTPVQVQNKASLQGQNWVPIQAQTWPPVQDEDKTLVQAKKKLLVATDARFKARDQEPDSWPRGNGAGQRWPSFSNTTSMTTTILSTLTAGSFTNTKTMTTTTLKIKNTQINMNFTKAMPKNMTKTSKMATVTINRPTTMNAAKTTPTKMTKVTKMTTPAIKNKPITVTSIKARATTIATVKTAPTTAANPTTMTMLAIKTTPRAMIIKSTSRTAVKTMAKTKSTVKATPTTTTETTTMHTPSIKTTSSPLSVIKTIPKTMITIKPTAVSTKMTTPQTTIITRPTAMNSIKLTTMELATDTPSPTASSGQATSAHVAKPVISSSRLREGETAKANPKTTVGGLVSVTVSDTTTLLTVLLFGQLFLITITLIFVRKVCENFRKRPYFRLDYLENGIYSDSTL